MKKATWFFLVLVVAGSAGCEVDNNGFASTTSPKPDSGDVSGTGGAQDAGSGPAGTGGRGPGGIAGSGGTPGSGGIMALAGAVGAGGRQGSGGITPVGGVMGSGGTMATDGAVATGGAKGTDAGTGAGGSPSPDGAKDSAGSSNGDALPNVPPDAAADPPPDNPPDNPIDRRAIDFPLVSADAREGENDTAADGGSPMTLIWSDEFDGPANTGVDTTKWSYITWDPGQVNDEDQKYTSRLQNVFQDGSGHLVLRALDTPYAGNRYTSGRIESSGHFEFKFGHVEVRAKLPAGIGSFPGIIAMGTTGNWPQCGQLALVEQYGQDKSWFYTSATAGSASGSGTTGNVKYTFPSATTASSDFHVYSLDWYADHIVFQVDGIEINRTTFGSSSPFFTIPEYLVLDLALGGNMGGDIDNDAFPMDMVVDYVRVYSF